MEVSPAMAVDCGANACFWNWNGRAGYQGPNRKAKRVKAPCPPHANCNFDSAQNTTVIMECGGLLVFAARPATQRENGSAFSDIFKTTTATLPSLFRKAVVVKGSRPEELTT